MAAQQILFAETIMGMKKAMARADDASESDEVISRPTNRGNKLKRKAKYVQEGRLDLADGPRIYRRKIEYNGYSRNIIFRNPPRIDADGDVVDDDDSDSLPDISDAEENPYGNLRLEELLMPLTSAADLDKHPSLAATYTNKVLEEMVQNAREMLESEQAALYKMKRLMVEFRGDDTWIPCGDLESDQDVNLLGPQRLGALAQASSNAFGPNWEGMSADLTATEPEDAMEVDGEQDNDHTTFGALANGAKHDAYDGAARTNGETQVAPEIHGQGVALPEGTSTSMQADANVAPSTETHFGNGAPESAPEVNLAQNEVVAASDTVPDYPDQETKEEDNGDHILPDAQIPQEILEDGVSGLLGYADNEGERPHRMTTRARAQATDEPTNDTSPRTSHISPVPSIPSVHPFFMVPRSSIPSRDFNLPYDEANETRRLITTYIQKQEEVCRGVSRLHAGLQKALRLRKTVLQWCKAESHVGEMSDGEDWYDREEWGLDEDLKKGEEAEEEEVVTGKKTRRRVA